MLRIGYVVTIVIGVSQSVLAASPDPKTLAVPSNDLSRSRELVQQLGSEEYNEREAAEQSLAAMGRMARTALLEGVNTDPSAEVRNRCAALLPRATAIEMKARLEVFLADVDGKYEHDLPGWNQFRAVVGCDFTLFGYVLDTDRTLQKAARSVFVELIATPANKAVVMATAASENELNAVVIARRQELCNVNVRMGRVGPGGGFAGNTSARRDASSEDIVALLFAESLAPQNAARILRQVNMANLMAGLRGSILREDDEKGRVYKAIAAAWLDSRTNPFDLFQGMSVASSLGMTDRAVRMAARMFATPGAPPAYRVQAANMLLSTGGREHIPLLEKLYEDNGAVPVMQGFVRVAGNAANVMNREYQVRDIALSVSIRLAGQDPVDFGFIDSLSHSEGGTMTGPSYARYYLTEDKRNAAFAKWKEWWAKNKDKK